MRAREDSSMPMAFVMRTRKRECLTLVLRERTGDVRALAREPQHKAVSVRCCVSAVSQSLRAVRVRTYDVL